jgi:hypothetical protein
MRPKPNRYAGHLWANLPDLIVHDNGALQFMSVGPKNLTRLKKCLAFLDYHLSLSDGPLPALELTQACREAGFKRRTIRQALELGRIAITATDDRQFWSFARILRV